MTRRTQRRRQRGVTLIEVLITLSVAVVLVGGAVMGFGAISSSRLRASSTRVASAMRIAYTHANSTTRVTRLVFDFEANTITVEDSPGVLYLQSGDLTGGAEATTEFEKQAIDEGKAIADGPRPTRPSFSPVKNLLGFAYDDSKKVAAKKLEEGIIFRQVEVMHEEGPVTEGRAYVYFFPGGMAERATVQVMKVEGEDDKDILTVEIAPLTGKTTIHGGPFDMPRPESDEEASEREDTL